MKYSLECRLPEVSYRKSKLIKKKKSVRTQLYKVKYSLECRLPEISCLKSKLKKKKCENPVIQSKIQPFYFYVKYSTNELFRSDFKRKIKTSFNVQRYGFDLPASFVC